MIIRSLRFLVLFLIAFVAASLVVATIVRISDPLSLSTELTQVQRRPVPQSPPFDLPNSSIPVEEIRGGGPPKDGIPAISNPNFVPQAKANFLKATDRVVGVSMGGKARAYPISILTQHEIVNDKIGDTHVAVTYCPLCDSVVVFDRTTEFGVKEFGVSGLLYNSNVLMYDRSEQESLWSQMKMEGVSGPAKGIKLRVLPFELTSWKAWQARFPNTEVMAMGVESRRNYSRNPYESYFQQDGLMFPAKPQSNELPLKERVVTVWHGDHSIVVPASYFDGKSGTASLSLEGKQFEVKYDAAADSLRVTSAVNDLKWVNSFWFAWHAFHPQTKILKK